MVADDIDRTHELVMQGIDQFAADRQVMTRELETLGGELLCCKKASRLLVGKSE